MKLFTLTLFLLVVHTLLLLVQATSLSVAINSYNNVLITIMISNNFVELKGSVFKKFETNNLFQMSCSGKQNNNIMIKQHDCSTAVIALQILEKDSITLSCWELYC